MAIASWLLLSWAHSPSLPPLNEKPRGKSEQLKTPLPSRDGTGRGEKGMGVKKGLQNVIQGLGKECGRVVSKTIVSGFTLDTSCFKHKDLLVWTGLLWVQGTLVLGKNTLFPLKIQPLCACLWKFFSPNRNIRIYTLVGDFFLNIGFLNPFRFPRKMRLDFLIVPFSGLLWGDEERSNERKWCHYWTQAAHFHSRA